MTSQQAVRTDKHTRTGNKVSVTQFQQRTVVGEKTYFWLLDDDQLSVSLAGYSKRTPFTAVIYCVCTADCCTVCVLLTAVLCVYC